MGQTGKYIHNSVHTGVNLGLTNAYGAAVRHSIPLNQDQSGIAGSKSGVGRLSALWVRVDTIAGATALTVRLSRDAAGDQPWIGDTTAPLSTGITTPTAGCITVKIDVDYRHNADDILYLHAKTNAGTCNVRVIELTWEE